MVEGQSLIRRSVINRSLGQLSDLSASFRVEALRLHQRTVDNRQGPGRTGIPILPANRAQRRQVRPGHAQLFRCDAASALDGVLFSIDPNHSARQYPASPERIFFTQGQQELQQAVHEAPPRQFRLHRQHGDGTDMMIFGPHQRPRRIEIDLQPVWTADRRAH